MTQLPLPDLGEVGQYTYMGIKTAMRLFLFREWLKIHAAEMVRVEGTDTLYSLDGKIGTIEQLYELHSQHLK
jgi:hypothetical protein